jgi:hypothetical protein
MTHFRSLAAVAVGSLVVAATAFAAQPYLSAESQAEQTCLRHHVKPNSSIWELCLSHVTRAYEWDEPALAQQLANTAGHVHESCLDQGYDAETSGYRACVNHEMDARSYLQILGDDRSGENVAEAR